MYRLTSLTIPYIMHLMNQAAAIEDWNHTDAPAEKVSVQQSLRLRYTHDAMIDLIIQEPGVSQAKLAETFGYTQAWVSTIMSSDAFKARLMNRREQLVDPAILLSIEERFKAVTERSLVVLAEKLSLPSTQIPDNLALRAAELGAKALGIGGNAPPQAAIGVDSLAILAKNLVALRGKVYENPAPTTKTIEGEFHEEAKQD